MFVIIQLSSLVPQREYLFMMHHSAFTQSSSLKLVVGFPHGSIHGSYRCSNAIDSQKCLVSLLQIHLHPPISHTHTCISFNTKPKTVKFSKLYDILCDGMIYVCVLG